MTKENISARWRVGVKGPGGGGGTRSNIMAGGAARPRKHAHIKRSPQPSTNVHYAAAAILFQRVGGPEGVGCRAQRRGKDLDAYYNR